MHRKVLFPQIFTLCLLSCFLTGFSKPNQKDSEICPKFQPKALCVFCPGIGGMVPSKVKKVENKIKKEIEAVESVQTLVEVIVPKHKQSDTFLEPIEAQSKEIVAQITERYRPGEVSIMFIAHSQGGLKAFIAAQELAKLGYQVKRIVTLGTPWEGIHALNKKREVLEAFGSIGSVHNSVIGLFQEGENRQGVDDMCPGSEFMKRIHETLRNNRIPILAMGGSYDLNTQEGIKPDVVKKLNGLVGDSVNDGLIPIESQLAKCIAPPLFERKELKGLHHGHLLKDWSNSIVSCKRVAKIFVDQTRM